MENANSQRRRRPITACIECVRRKQKCDRRKPCNGCIARGVQDKCIFPSGLSQTQESRKETDDVLDLAVGLGYSPHNKISNTLHDLQHPTSRGTTLSSKSNIQKSHASYNSPKYHVLVSRLPSETIMDQLVDVFFAEAGWYFCLVDQPYYDELVRLWKISHASSSSPDSDDGLSATSLPTGLKSTFVQDVSEIQYFPAVLFQMLALALHFLPPSHPVRHDLRLTDQPSADQMSKTWSDDGHEVMSVLGRIESPLAAVIADLLRCTWLKNSGLGGNAWHVLSDAVRQAQHLGLHKKSIVPRADTIEDTIRNLWYDEHRRRVWVSVFSWDAHMSLSLDRPRLIIVGDCTVERPLDCDLPAEPSKVVPTAAGVAGQPSRFTSQLFKYNVGYLIHEAMSSGALRPSCRDYDMITLLHERIKRIVKALPTQDWDIPNNTDTALYRDVSKQKQQISIITSSFIMSLHRPHVMHRATSRLLAAEAALDTLTASQSLFELCEEQHYKIHTILFHTIDSVIFLSSMIMAHCKSKSDLTSMSNEGLPSYSRVHDAIYQSIKRMSAMRERSNVAREAEKAVRKCYELVSRCEREYCTSLGTPSAEDTYSNLLITNWTPSSDQNLVMNTSAPINSARVVGDSYGSNLPSASSYPIFPGDSIDTSIFDDMPDLLYNPEVINNASHTSAWMEHHAFIDDTLVSTESSIIPTFPIWS